jgi:hypothetical protein
MYTQLLYMYLHTCCVLGASLTPVSLAGALAEPATRHPASNGVADQVKGLAGVLPIQLRQSLVQGIIVELRGKQCETGKAVALSRGYQEWFMCIRTACRTRLVLYGSASPLSKA